MVDGQSEMKRLPGVFSFLLFLALSATLAYWIVQWTALAPRTVSAPSKSEHPMPPVSAAASLFGGRSSGSVIANLQLRGVIHAGSEPDSVAIIALEGKPPRALTVNSEIVSGVIVKEILNKTVVVSEKGVERELGLPAFAAQEGSAAASQASMPPTPNLPTANPSAAVPTAISSGVSGSGGTRANSSPPAAILRPTSQPQGIASPAASEPAKPPSSQ
jgi:general secretion pathway protein C